MAKPAKIQNGMDVTKALEKAGCSVRHGRGSHCVGSLPNGQTLTYYEHGQLPKGMLHRVVKMLAESGVIK